VATEVQSDTAEADPCAFSTAAITEGNLITMFIGGRSGNADTTWTPSSGWTKVFGNTVTDVTTRRAVALYYKVAGSGESTTPQVDGNETLRGIFQEFALEGGEGETGWTLVGNADNDSGTTQDETVLSLGTTGSVTGDRFLVLGCSFVKVHLDPDTQSSTFATITLGSNINFGTGTDESRYNATAFSNETDTGTYTSTGTYAATTDTSNWGLTSGIAVFRTKAAATTDYVGPIWQQGDSGFVGNIEI